MATRLHALDDAFLAAETARTPTHVGSVCTFEAGPLRDAGRIRLRDLQDSVASRLHLVPRLRQVVASPPFGVAPPLLVDDADFDITHHVRLAAVAAPGDQAALQDLAATLHTERLDRSRPLWELWFVDGLADGRVGLVEKIHHAIADGVSGVEVASVLLDLEPSPPTTPAPGWEPLDAPAPAAQLLAGLGDRVVGPLGRVAGALSQVRRPGAALASVGRGVRGLGALLDPPLRAPATSLNAPVGPHRQLLAVRRDLAEVRRAAHRRGATVNDLVLTAVGGGLRTLLDHRGELPVDADLALHVLVPVSLHRGGDLGNVVGGIVVRLPVGDADVEHRLSAVQGAMAAHKASGEGRLTADLLGAADLFPTSLAHVVSRSVHRQPLVNVIVTNVPGPDAPLYALGARMLDAVPIVPLGGNLTVSIGVLSYDGRLVVGLFADPEACPDLRTLADGVEEGFDALEALAEVV